jgi:divalent metal cation (Fe/Co/Zn/Cd) transporter
MRGLPPALGIATLMLLSWIYPGALALLAAASHSVAGLAAMTILGWSVLCVLLIRAVHAGVSSS